MLLLPYDLPVSTSKTVTLYAPVFPPPKIHSIDVEFIETIVNSYLMSPAPPVKYTLVLFILLNLNPVMINVDFKIGDDELFDMLATTGIISAVTVIPSG